MLSHGGTIALPVDGSRQTATVDPQAFVAHVGQVNVDIAASTSAGATPSGRGSGEAIQLKITGHGTVYVQASEQKI